MNYLRADSEFSEKVFAVQTTEIELQEVRERLNYQGIELSAGFLSQFLHRDGMA
jgi:hypothetical protein